MRANRAALTARFDDGEAFELSARLLRAMTPSAAERGHGGPAFEPSPRTPAAVLIRDVIPVGRYAVRLVFNDGHDTGLYSWERLHRIGREREALEARLA